MAGSVTPATAQLTGLGIGFTVHEFEHDRRTSGYGEEAVDTVAARLGVAPDRVLKTLVTASRSGLVVAVLPVPAMLSLKAAAAASGTSKLTMADPAAVRRSSGYVLGGVSPFGQRTVLPTVVDASALEHETVLVSGGRRGLEIEVAPSDLVTVTRATIADIRRSA